VASSSASLTQNVDVKSGFFPVHRLLDTVKTSACALVLIEQERLDVWPALCLVAVSRCLHAHWEVYTNSSLRSAAKLDALAEDVDDFSLSFVTPLGAEYDDGRHCIAAVCDCAVVDFFVVLSPFCIRKKGSSNNSRI
jgi:hypothetical protein